MARKKQKNSISSFMNLGLDRITETKFIKKLEKENTSGRKKVQNLIKEYVDEAVSLT